MPLLAALVLVLGAILWSPRAGAASPREPRAYDVGPAPGWVATIEDAEVPAASATAALEQRARDGVYLALADDQVQVQKDGVVTSFRRRVQRITSGAGVEHAAELRFEVDPSYERLTLHAIRIVRGGRMTDALDERDVRVLEQETDLEQRVYNGRITVLVVLRDVRVGDAIDYAYSIRGQNPVMAGRFARDVPLAGPLFTQRLRVRLVAPAAREIAMTVKGIDLTPTIVLGPRDGERETVWERRNVDAVVFEGDAPSWFVPWPRVMLTEHASWGDVARWATPLFDVRASPAGDRLIDAKVAELRVSHADLADRALAAVRFVQDDVRYLGIEMGENSHRPHPPAAVLAQRFGDCKDKALLLVTLLRALGVEAHVALVSTELGARIDEHPPAPIAFDHAIVRATLGGAPVWIDATRSQQGGSLTAHTPPPFGRALVVAEGTRDLETIASPRMEEPETAVVERYETHGDEATKLTIETTLRQDEADAMRSRLTRESHADVRERSLNAYARWAPGIRAEGELDVRDDRSANVIVVRERYTVPGLWKNGAVCGLSAVLAPALARPRVPLRASPLGVRYPTFLRHEVVVRRPGHALEAHDDVTLTSDALVLTVRSDVGRDAARVIYELRTRTDAVPPQAVAAHLATVEAMRDALEVAVREAPAEEPSRFVDGLIGLGGIAGIVLIVALVKTVPRAIRRRRFRRAATLQTGETAMLAIAVSDRLEAERHLRAMRCACGAPLAHAAANAAWDQVRLGDRAVTLGKASCARCGATRTRYFAM
jgi:transglutaminase-like putative cysteine protease